MRAGPAELVRDLECTWSSFRELTTEQLYEVLELRQRVFVLEQKCFYEDIDRADPTCFHAQMRSGVRLVACARLAPPRQREGAARVGRVVVDQRWRGIGVGARLVRGAIAYAREHFPEHGVVLSAQAHLIPFYTQLGFRGVGGEYDDGGILHCDMALGS